MSARRSFAARLPPVYNHRSMGTARIASFVGFSNSGKTGLVEALVAEYARRGEPCAAAKATRHGGDFEPPGKDSARFRRAGAAATAFIGLGEGGLTVRFSPSPPEPDRDYLEALFPTARTILVEGLVVEGAAKVLVVGGAEPGKGAGKPGRAPLPAAAPSASGAPPGLPETKRPLEWADLVVTSDPELAARAAAAGARAAAPGDAAAIISMLEDIWKGT